MLHSLPVERVEGVLEVAHGADARVLPLVQKTARAVADGQAAELRETYQRACDEEQCTPELQAEVAEVVGYLEVATERALGWVWESSAVRARARVADGKRAPAVAAAAGVAAAGPWPGSRARGRRAEPRLPEARAESRAVCGRKWRGRGARHGPRGAPGWVAPAPLLAPG